MAKTVPANLDATKGESTLMVNPNDLVVDPKFRGRAYDMTPRQIKDMAISLLEKGQEEPIVIRGIGAGGKEQYTPIFGFTRTEAGKLIVKGFKEGSKTYHDPNFRLRAELKANRSDREAFEDNVVENAHRNATTDIDDATNMRLLIERYGYTQADVSRLYRCTKIKVTHLLRLLSLPDDLRLAVHEGRMARNCALDFMNVPTEKQAAALKAATVSKKGEPAKYSTSAMREFLRENGYQSDVGDDGEAAGGKKRSKKTKGGKDAKPAKLPRPSLTTFLNMMDAEQTSAESTEKSRRMANAIAMYLRGERKTAWFSKEFSAVCG